MFACYRIVSRNQSLTEKDMATYDNPNIMQKTFEGQYGDSFTKIRHVGDAVLPGGIFRCSVCGYEIAYPGDAYLSLPRASCSHNQWQLAVLVDAYEK